MAGNSEWMPKDAVEQTSGDWMPSGAIEQQSSQQNNKKMHFGVFGSIPESEYQLGQRNIAGNIFERPGAAIRSALQGKGYVAGAMNPTNVPNFQDLAIKASQQTTSPVANAALGFIPSAVGLAADMVTNPADMLTALAPKIPLGSGKNIGNIIGNSGLGKSLEKIGNTEIHPIEWIRKSFNTPEKMENLAKSINNLSRESLREFGKPYEDILGRNSNVSGYVSKLPEHIQQGLENVGVDRNSKISLKELWNKRNDISANLSQSFFNNQNLGIKNKYTMKQINNVSQDLKNIILDSIPQSDRSEWLTNDNLYKQVKQPLTKLMNDSYDPKSRSFNIKPLISLYSSKENAPQQLALERLAKNYAPELMPILKQVKGYLIRETQKKIAKNIAVGAGFGLSAYETGKFIRGH